MKLSTRRLDNKTSMISQEEETMFTLVGCYFNFLLHFIKMFLIPKLVVYDLVVVNKIVHLNNTREREELIKNQIIPIFIS